ncbi:MAG TPA: ferrous iron transport protein A [Gammaproteobacteria bacterium]|nr:ferrous iron transport protein A [Gammaproteobacteria bacterium]
MFAQTIQNETCSTMTIKLSQSSRNGDDTKPLHEVKTGGCARVVEIEGGKNRIQRLMGLGLTIGSEVEILHHRGKGVVVGLNGNRIAVGHGIAEAIRVEQLESCGD